MQTLAHAKINLSLDVIETLPNGYHSLDMIMATISLADLIEAYPAKLTSIHMDGKRSEHVDNTIQKVLQLYDALFHIGPYRVQVTKNIPSQAGLGGASADAASLMIMLNDRLHLGLSLEDLMELGIQVGADVPYCLHQGWARVQGIGEVITPIKTDWRPQFILAKPDEGVCTQAAFEAWHLVKPLDLEACQRALEKSDQEGIFTYWGNALEPSAFALTRSLAPLAQQMRDLGLKVRMSGSGSCLMGFGDVSVIDMIDAPFKRIVEVL